MNPEPNDVLTQAVAVKNAAIEHANELERVERFQVDVADWIARMNYVRSQLIEQRLNPRLADGLAPALWCDIQRGE